jgi:hypothetical protein
VSYSRWSNSCWYTYADVNGGFTICDEINFSDEDLKDIDKCLEFFKDSDYTKEEIEELRGYMNDYINDRPFMELLEKMNKDSGK